MPNAVSFETNSNFHPNWKRTRSSVEMDMWLITFVTSIIYEQWKTTQANGFPIVMCRWSCCCFFGGWLVGVKIAVAVAVTVTVFRRSKSYLMGWLSDHPPLFAFSLFVFNLIVCVCIFVLCFASDDFFLFIFIFHQLKRVMRFDEIVKA